MIQQHFLGELGMGCGDFGLLDPCSDTSSVHVSEDAVTHNPFQMELFEARGNEYLSLPNDRLPGDFVTGEDEFWGEFAPKP